MQIRKEARTKTEKLRSLKSVKASGGKILLSLNPWAERKGGVWGSVRQYIDIKTEPAPAIRMGMAVGSTRRKPMSRPATIHPAVPSTRIDPKSCLGSFIWRKASALVSAIVGM